MPLIHVPNLRFEDELTGPLQAQPAKLEQLTAELAALIALRADPGDVVLVEHTGVPESAGLPDCLARARFLTLPELREQLRSAETDGATTHWQLAPWGWSDSMQRLLLSLRLSQTAPDLQAIRRVNTRAFAAEFDGMVSVDAERLECPFSRLCDSVRQVEVALTELSDSAADRWVIKANLSHAARNRLLGQGRQLNPEQLAWLTRRLQRDEPVCVEPWVRRLRECGLQWTISEDSGRLLVTFDGAAEMLTDTQGQYRGSLIGGIPGDPCWWQPAIEHGRRVAAAAGKLGFRGPLGIDCMLVEHAGRQWLRPAHDINGRQTMGRLALSLERRLPHGFYGAWCHIPTLAPGIEPDFSCNPPNSVVVAQRTGPARMAGRLPGLQTLLLSGSNSALVTAAAMKLTHATVPVCTPSTLNPRMPS
ncbi:MAG: hypothetical protein ACKO2P_06255 [Planctomycetota bacterium]